MNRSLRQMITSTMPTHPAPIQNCWPSSFARPTTIMMRPKVASPKPRGDSCQVRRNAALHHSALDLSRATHWTLGVSPVGAPNRRVPPLKALPHNAG